MFGLPGCALLILLLTAAAYAESTAPGDSTPLIPRRPMAIGSALAVHSDAVRDDAYRTELAQARETAARERAAMKRGCRVTAVAWCLVAAGVGLKGLKHEMDARDAYREADRLYLAYQQTTSETDAVSLRRQCIAAAQRGNRAAMRRNLISGAAIGAFGVSVALWEF